MPNPTHPGSDLPPGLLRDLIETLAHHGHNIDPTDALPALITLLHGGERRSSTELIFRKLVATHNRPQTDFIRGEQLGRIDDLAIITGRAHSGIRTNAEQASEHHS